MKKFINKHKYKFIVLICLLFGGISYAGATIYFSASNVTYSNSKLSATNVQKAIEELHAVSKECMPMTGARMVSKMGVTSVTSGCGVYADSVESGRYIYRGGSSCTSGAVNNYICLDTNSSGSCASNDLYRIIAIEADGTLKVIKNINIGSSKVWDPGYSSSVSGVTNSSSINGTRYMSSSSAYCYASSTSSYYGCNAWGSSTSTYASDGTTHVTTITMSGTEYTLPTYDAYLNVYLNGGKYLKTSSSGNSSTYQTITGWIESQNATIQNNIVEYLYNVGPSLYTTISSDVSHEAAYKWKGKIALINGSDYVRASTNSACTSTMEYYNSSSCYNNSSTHNWLSSSTSYKTLLVSTGSSHNTVVDVRSNGALLGYNAYNASYIRPVFHLSSSITLTGSGTNDANVYRISS